MSFYLNWSERGMSGRTALEGRRQYMMSAEVRSQATGTRAKYSPGSVAGSMACEKLLNGVNPAGKCE